MKILIIGSKGFIGSHCVDYFSREHEIWQCDVGVDYSLTNYFQIDATNSNFETVFKSVKFDICINCSGAASVPDSIENPLRDFVLNTQNVFKQLDALRQFNSSCKYINLSSAAVYGNPECLPISEGQSLQPISPYGRHKKMAEDICLEFHELYQVSTCSLRVFSAYGPGLQKQLFWDLYKKYKANTAIELWGTGNESRDFIYISDLVNALECVMLNGDFIGEQINVANGKEIAIKTVVSVFYTHIDPKISFTFAGQQRVGDPVNWVANVDRLLALGYKQKVDIKTGLANYIEWLKEKE